MPLKVRYLTTSLWRTALSLVPEQSLSNMYFLQKANRGFPAPRNHRQHFTTFGGHFTWQTQPKKQTNKKPTQSAPKKQRNKNPQIQNRALKRLLKGSLFQSEQKREDRGMSSSTLSGRPTFHPTEHACKWSRGHRRLDWGITNRR